MPGAYVERPKINRSQCTEALVAGSRRPYWRRSRDVAETEITNLSGMKQHRAEEGMEDKDTRYFSLTFHTRDPDGEHATHRYFDISCRASFRRESH